MVKQKLNVKRIKFGLQLKLTISFMIMLVIIIGGRTFLLDLAIKNESIDTNFANLASMAGALLLGIVVSFYSIRIFVIKPIDVMKDYITKIAAGDFQSDLPDDITKKKDEFGVIADSLKFMQESI